MIFKGKGSLIFLDRGGGVAGEGELCEVVIRNNPFSTPGNFQKFWESYPVNIYAS